MSAHRTGEPVESELARIAERWAEAWAGRDPALFTDCCTLDVQYEDPVARTPLNGRPALVAHAETLWAGFSKTLRVEAIAPPLFGDGYACLPWRVLGRHTARLGGFPPTRRLAVVHGLHYVELEGDRIRRARGFFDLYDAGVQLGLIPPRGGVGESAMLFLRGFGLRPRSGDRRPAD